MEKMKLTHFAQQGRIANSRSHRCTAGCTCVCICDGMFKDTETDSFMQTGWAEILMD